MKTSVGILRWAVVLAAAGGAIWGLLSNDLAAGRWVLAAVLVGHGVVHTMFLIPAPKASAGGPSWPFDMARSWTVTGVGMDLRLVRSVGLALIVVVVGGFALAGLSTVGVLVPTAWWQATVVASAVASAILLALFFEPQLILGPGIDAVLIAAVASGAWVL